MKKKTRQIIMMIVSLCLAVVLGGGFYVYFWLQNSVPVSAGIILTAAIDREVEITFDKMGIPQIWAETEPDGYFALGFLHANDRLFQMDMARRMSQGRMSELLGKLAMESDMRQRRIGHNRIAAAAILNLSEANSRKLQAYSDGVNYYRSTAKALPFEYLLLGKDFEDWKVYDCLTLLSFQSWFSDALQNHDQFFLKLSEAVGDDLAKSLCFIYPDWGPTTVPEDSVIGLREPAKSANIYVQLKTAVKTKWKPVQTPYLMTNSSNAWVVSPAKSKSGQAMLASDPHLQINQLPQFWQMIGLHIKETNINVLGITAPGLPFVIMGHNGTAAWAFTAGGVDITDYYLEEINADDSTEYRTASGWEKLKFVIDTIFAADLDSSVILKTPITRNGPIFNNLSESNKTYSFRWAGYDVDLNSSCSAAFALQEVAGFEEFRKIVTSLGALDANWLYADKDGNIGYQLGTPIPVRQTANFCLPLSGTNSEHDWLGYYPLSQTPYSFNPEQNWLGSCNNLPSRSAEFAELSGSFMPGRIMRLSELMNKFEMISTTDLNKFQNDRTDNYLLRWKKIMVTALSESGETDLAEMIHNWDGSTAVGSKETAIAIEFVEQLRKHIFEDELGELSAGVRSFWIDEVFEDSSLHFWFDDISTEDKTETIADITRAAMSAALKIVNGRSWGELNSLSMNHPMGRLPLIADFLNINHGPWDWPGTSNCLNASYIVSNSQNGYSTVVGASWRFVIDFSKVDEAEFTLPSGNSGNPMSEHFFDFFDFWRYGGKWKVPFSYDKVKEKAVSVLTIRPAQSSD